MTSMWSAESDIDYREAQYPSEPEPTCPVCGDADCQCPDRDYPEAEDSE